MNSIIKQCIINQLDIPRELREVVKSYCFYDIKSWETIQFIRYKKEYINHLFKNNIIRENEPDLYGRVGHWDVYVDTDEDRYRCQFQGTNCIICGNYIQEYAPHYISTKIICNCEFYMDVDSVVDYDLGTDSDTESESYEEMRWMAFRLR